MFAGLLESKWGAKLWCARSGAASAVMTRAVDEAFVTRILPPAVDFREYTVSAFIVSSQSGPMLGSKEGRDGRVRKEAGASVWAGGSGHRVGHRDEHPPRPG